MILIDAVFINNGGGKVLLDYLIERLEDEKINLHYLIDKRIYKNHYKISLTNKVTYIEAGLLSRYFFYKKNANKFTKILCFGNVPPPIKSPASVFTYFHNYLFLVPQIGNNFIDTIKLKFKKKVIKYYSKNTNFWIVQTESVKISLSTIFKILTENILIIPFYRKYFIDNFNTKQEKTYLYVSNAYQHKNHKFLIEAFCKFYDQHKFGKLILTVDKKYNEINSIISDKLKLGYPIDNVGFLNRIELQKLYSSSDFIVYPSLFESFGLGLIEGIECGCKVIGSNLSYTFDICEPSLLFNPHDCASLTNAFKLSIDNKLKKSTLKVTNKINQLIDVLKN